MLLPIPRNTEIMHDKALLEFSATYHRGEAEDNSKEMKDDPSPLTKTLLYMHLHFYSKTRKQALYEEVEITQGLQKIIGSLACRVRLYLTRSWIKLKKVLIHVLPNL